MFNPPTSPQETLNPSWLPVTVFRFGDVSELSDVEIGTAARIDGEMVRIDAIDLNANTVTVSRGCLDTVPADHPAGAVLWAYDSGDFPLIPTYKRMCVCILKNDHLCKYMGFALTRWERGRRNAALEKYRNL